MEKQKEKMSHLKKENIKGIKAPKTIKGKKAIQSTWQRYFLTLFLSFGIYAFLSSFNLEATLLLTPSLILDKSVNPSLTSGHKLTTLSNRFPMEVILLTKYSTLVNIGN